VLEHLDQAVLQPSRMMQGFHQPCCAASTINTESAISTQETV